MNQSELENEKISEKQAAYSGLFFITLLLTSFILRGPIAAVGSLLPIMNSELTVSSGAFGFITTVPCLAFAASSLLIPWVAKRMGLVELLALGTLLAAIGMAVRSAGGYEVLLVGTLILGFGISTGNVLLPVAVKRFAPDKIGIYTSSYISVQNIGAALGAGISLTLALKLGLGWRITMAFWAVPAVLTSCAWLVLRMRTKGKVDDEVQLAGAEQQKIGLKSLRKSKLAWYMTLVMGLQSLNYYMLTAWLPTLTIEAGVSAQWSALIGLMFQFLQLPALFLAPIIISRMANKTMVIVGSGMLCLVGLLMILFVDFPALMAAGALLLALGAGASYAWVVTMTAIVTKDVEEAAMLSGMVQCFGYILAAIGPTLAGVIFDASGSWMAVLSLPVIASVGIMVFGGLTKDKHITY